MSLNHIHPSAFIGDRVQMGTGNIVGPSAVVTGDVELGDRNWIGPNACIGIEGDLVGIPNTSAEAWWEDGRSQADFGVRIGSENVVKEAVTVHAGSRRHTRVANSCYLMPRAHLGHDGWLGDQVLVSPAVQIAGHVAIGDRAVIGMGALIHQHSSVGPVAMVGMGCAVRGQVAPCRTVVGNPQLVSGINRVGLERMLGPERDHQRALELPQDS